MTTKSPETQLSTAFAETSKLYQKLYNEPYSLCLCWYCESVRAGHSTSSITRLFSRNAASADASVASALAHNAPSDIDKSAHISAHNASHPITDNPEYVRLAAVHANNLEANYQKACKLARKQGRSSTRAPQLEG